MSDRIEVRVNGAVAWTYEAGTVTVPPPPPPPPPNPPAPPSGQVPQNYAVNYDFGVGGGDYFPRDGRETHAGQLITVAFTVVPGGNPNLDVFPGLGGWRARQITDYFPFLTNAETRGLPLGNTSDGRGAEHEAGIPLACYEGGRFYYSVYLDATQDWRIQFRQ
jgi:hypothetical protein